MNTRASKTRAVLVVSLAAAAGLSGCQSPAEHRRQADETAHQIIEETQQQALGRTEHLEIDSPADTLRRRLIVEQDLPHSTRASLGTAHIEKVEHWPDPEFFTERPSQPAYAQLPPELQERPVELGLNDALRVAAAHSRAYQTQKENVFRTALNLDLERQEFRTTFAGLLEGALSTDMSGPDTVTGVEGTGSLSASRQFETGAAITSRIAVDLVRLLTAPRESSLGLLADVSVEVPLLRGAGRHIVREPLTQAERDTVYAIFDFEEFKRDFAVSIASGYLDVLSQLDQVRNAEENYRQLIFVRREADRLANEGRRDRIQVDQARQNELQARLRWIAAVENYQRQLDNFKIQLGLPTDSRIELDPEELERLAEQVEQRLDHVLDEEWEGEETNVPADAPVELEAPERYVGPFELEPDYAVRLALANRLDLQIATAEVEDAQRQVVVAANQFLPDLVLGGEATIGERRGIGSAGLDDAQLRFDQGRYEALLSMDLPLERTAERVAYRNTLINLEQTVRDLQETEDEIKFQIRNNLRQLLESREGIGIEAMSVLVAQRRVEQTRMLLDLGREGTQIRDVLEAQEALISAQNALTAELVSYRIAELELQRDLGLLEVGVDGLWEEIDPEELARYLEPETSESG